MEHEPRYHEILPVIREGFDFVRGVMWAVQKTIMDRIVPPEALHIEDEDTEQ